jgi:hypothetical protein
LSDCCNPKAYGEVFNEKRARAEAKRFRRKGLDATSRRIAEIVKADGVAGGTLLEVGGGVGSLEIELLKAGMARAVNVELAPTYERVAGELLAEAALSERVERRVMDFAESGDEVEAADLVVLNRVVCCYPDMPKLTTAAATHARKRLVLSFPNQRWWTRLGLSLINLLFAASRGGFRVFGHPPAQIVAAVERHGFTTRVNQAGMVWQVVAFERTA